MATHQHSLSGHLNQMATHQPSARYMQFAGSGGNAAMSVAIQGCDYIQKAITTSAFHIRITVASLSYYIVLIQRSRCSASTSHEYNYTKPDQK